MSEITRILEAIEGGNPQATEALLPLVYDELRRLAAGKMSMLPPGQTLQATALVHEAYLKLAGNPEHRWESRKHFFAAAAEAMRHILIDRARRRFRVRHGEGRKAIDLEAIEIAAPETEEVLLLLNEALEELATRSSEQAQIVKLRFFAGLSESETAEILGVSLRSVQRHWAYARAWLFERIDSNGSA